jgi:surfactin synthase thioesterase subunit
MPDPSNPNRAGKWWVRLDGGKEGRVRLLCLPHAGGGPSAYRPWKEGLPPFVELHAAHLPGREARIQEQPPESLAGVVEALGSELKGMPPMPAVLFGHSLGALIGFELVHALRREDRPLPARLMVSGARAPQLPYPHRLLHRMNDSELTQAMLRYSGTPAVVAKDPEMMRIFLPAIRADFRLLETYVYRSLPPLPVPIDGLAGESDDIVLPEEVAGWRAQTSAGFSMARFGGGHFFLQDSRALVVAEVARRCEDALSGGDRDG